MSFKDMATPDNAEHIGLEQTGDNIEAKRVANYVWTGTAWERMAQPGGSDGATSAKQDLLLAELQQKTEPSDIQNVEIINALRVLLQQIATPVWYDPTTNTLKVGTHAVTVSSGTVTTVTNLTNFGTNAADVMARDTSINTWANVARRTIS